MEKKSDVKREVLVSNLKILKDKMNSVNKIPVEKKDSLEKIKIVSVLQKYPEGLSLEEIIKKTGLSKDKIIIELKKLEEEKTVEDKEEIEKIQEIKKPIENNKLLKTVSKEKIIPKTLGKKIPVQPKQEIVSKPQSNFKSKQTQILEQRIPIKKIVGDLKEKESEKKVENYILTGVSGFDKLLEKGIPKGNSILVAGGAGSGKTIFCLQILANHALKGKKCFYMSLEENEKKLMKHLNDFGFDADKLIKDGNLKIQRINPFDIARSVDAMLAKQKGELLIEVDPIILPKDFNPEFIVVDSLTSIASTFISKEEGYRIYIEQLFRFFEKLDATSFLITETKQIPEIFSTTGVEEFLADGVIVFYNIKRGNIREKAIEVLKLRGAKHQKRIVAMSIEDKVGVKVYPEQEIFGSI